MKIYKVTDLITGRVFIYRYYKESYLTDWGFDPTQKKHKLEIIDADYHKYLQLKFPSIPEEFLNWVSYHAYQQGHSAGDDEIVSIAEEIVVSLGEVIEKYTNRILKK